MGTEKRNILALLKIEVNLLLTFNCEDLNDAFTEEKYIHFSMVNLLII